MVASNRQIEANRKNAKRSTGPKTAEGKERACRNALRHGLSRRGTKDNPATATIVAELSSTVDCSLELAAVGDIARSKLELLEIRRIRRNMLAGFLQSPSLLLEYVKRLKGLDRYERAAFSKQKRSLRSAVAR